MSGASIKGFRIREPDQGRVDMGRRCAAELATVASTRFNIGSAELWNRTGGITRAESAPEQGLMIGDLPLRRHRRTPSHHHRKAYKLKDWRQKSAKNLQNLRSRFVLSRSLIGIYFSGTDPD